MAYEEGLTFARLTGKAAADLSAKQFFAMLLGSSGINVATAAKAMDGILQDNPKSGQAGCIAYAGVSKCAISASNALTQGSTVLEVDTGGTLKAVASGIVVAQASATLSSTAAVCIVACRLLPANALFA